MRDKNIGLASLVYCNNCFPRPSTWCPKTLLSYRLAQNDLKPWRYYLGGDAVCGARLKPLHLHDPFTSVGDMEDINLIGCAQPLRKCLNLIYCIFYSRLSTCPRFSS